MRHKEVVPRLAGDGGGVFAPLSGGGGFGLDYVVSNFGFCLGFAEIICCCGLGDEIGFVVGFAAIVDLECPFVGLHPLEDGFVVLQDHCKSSFRIGVKFLNWEKAFLKTSKQHGANVLLGFKVSKPLLMWTS